MNDSRIRKLEAILFADIEGYTSLMQRDEISGLETVKRFKRTLNKEVSLFGGNIVQYYGDGCLITFQNALNAVECSIELQKSFQVNPAIPVRIGIHMGDVVYEDHTILSDSINIASRIEGIGHSGSILISKAVKDQVSNHPEFSIHSTGYHELKNVEEPLEVFAVTSDNLPAPVLKYDSIKKDSDKKIKKRRSIIRKLAIWGLALTILLVALIFSVDYYLSKNNNTKISSPSSWNSSIAIMPFKNLGNPNQEYLSIGISNAIRDKLRGLSQLSVVPRPTSMMFKGRDISLAELGKELGVTHILEGSIDQIDENLNINISLAEVATNRVIWSPPAYSANNNKIFDLQDSIALEIADHLNLALSKNEKERIKKRYTNDPHVFDLALKAESLDSDSLWKEVIRIEPGYVPAFFALAFKEMTKGIFTGIGDPDSSLEASKKYVDAALNIDPENGDCLALKASHNFYFDWNFKEAERLYTQAIHTSEYALFPYLHLLLLTGRIDEAKNIVEGLNSPEFLYHRWQGKHLVSFVKGDYEEALENIQIGIKKFPNDPTNYMELGRLYNQINKPELAIIALEKSMELFNSRPPIFLAHLAVSNNSIGNGQEVKRLIDELENRSILKGASGSPAFGLGMVYSAMGDDEQSLEWLEKAYLTREVEMIWLRAEPNFKPLHSNSKYQKLVSKMGL